MRAAPEVDNASRAKACQAQDLAIADLELDTPIQRVA
jgi:hypothetical protein